MSRVSPSRLPPPQPTPSRRRSLEGWASFRHAQARHSTIDGGSVTYLTPNRLSPDAIPMVFVTSDWVHDRKCTHLHVWHFRDRFIGHIERKEERAGLPTSVRESPRTAAVPAQRRGLWLCGLV